MVMHPSGKFILLTTAYLSFSQSVVTIYINPTDGNVIYHVASQISAADFQSTISISADERFAYTVSYSNKKIFKIPISSITSSTVASAVTTGNTESLLLTTGSPYRIGIDPYNRFLFVSNYDNNTVYTYQISNYGFIKADYVTSNGKMEIIQDSGSNNRLVLRGQPGSSYRWNIDNYQAQNDFRIFREDDATAASGQLWFRIDATGTLAFNSGYGAVANAYGCRAWVNFDGTGTPAIRGSGNASSITDNGAGDYTVNFTQSLPNANYAVVCTTETDSVNDGHYQAHSYYNGRATGSVRVIIRYSTNSSSYDVAYFGVAVFR
jgi:hypothetical protein